MSDTGRAARTDGVHGGDRDGHGQASRPAVPRAHRVTTSGDARARRQRHGSGRRSRSATRRAAITRRRTCCTRRCGSGSARTCARRARSWRPIGCASTSRTSQPLTDDETRDVERVVNEQIYRNTPVDDRRSDRTEDAIKAGAMALFGEKYGDRVRVVSIAGLQRRALRRHARARDRRHRTVRHHRGIRRRGRRAPHRGADRRGRGRASAGARRRRSTARSAALGVPAATGRRGGRAGCRPRPSAWRARTSS